MKSLLKYVFVGLLYYIFVSFEENFIHKYIMHYRIDIPYFRETYDEHIKHHKSITKDFTTQNNGHENICFNVSTIIPICIANTLLLYAFFHKVAKFQTILTLVVFTQIIHAIIWNSYHSYIHSFNVNNICDIYGISKEHINENNIYSKWSIQNHKAHHYYKNDEKGNYNVVFPGADFILGTHNILPPTL